MLKYLVACSAAIYCVLLLFGDESRRPEVTRQVQDDVTGISMAAMTLPEEPLRTRTVTGGMSDAEAVRVALEAGKEYRAQRKPEMLRGLTAAVETAPAAAGSTSDVTPKRDYRYVSGSRVNLRAGPGTGNAVVGQLVQGDAAEVLDDRDGWFQVRTADGAISGWISGRFLTDRKPG